MNILLLIITIIAITFQSPFAKIYNKKTGNRSAYFYSFLLSFVAMIFFVVTSKNLEFSKEFIIYSIGFALSYGSATIANLLALRYGSLALTTLIVSFSLMIPTTYGLIFLNEPTSVWLFLGLLFLAISLFLVHYQKGEKKFSLKWLIFVLISFIGNGMCSTVQKMEQIAFSGGYKNEFMIVSLLIVSSTFLILSLITERQHLKESIKSGFVFPIFVGLLNGLVNLLVMVLGNKMPASLMFPLITSGHIIGSYILSKFYFKEDLTKMQTVGLFAGIVAVVFFNL